MVVPEGKVRIPRLIKRSLGTPQGKATSDYLGVLPIGKEITVDFCRLNRIVAMESCASAVTVQTGAVWKRLEAVTVLIS